MALTNRCNLREKVIGPDFRWLMHDGRQRNDFPRYLPRIATRDWSHKRTQTNAFRADRHRGQNDPGIDQTVLRPCPVSIGYDMIVNEKTVPTGVFCFLRKFAKFQWV